MRIIERMVIFMYTRARIEEAPLDVEGCMCCYHVLVE